MKQVARGARVIVRTAGDYPKVRRLWEINKIAAIVAEEEAYRKLRAGLPVHKSGAVAVPAEDVFEYSNDAAEAASSETPWDGWSDLDPIARNFS